MFPLFDVMDLVDLVTVMASAEAHVECKNNNPPLTAESAKWLTWKIDGWAGSEAQKISECFPTIVSLIESTDEILNEMLGAELAMQVSSMLQSDFHIE
jgi:hypothetical protein